MFSKPSDPMWPKVMSPDPFIQRPAERSNSRSHQTKDREGPNDAQVTRASRVEMVSRRAEAPLDTIILEASQFSRKSLDKMKVSTSRRGRPRKNNGHLGMMRPEKPSNSSSNVESSESKISVTKDAEKSIKKGKDPAIVKKEPTRNKDGSIRKVYTPTGKYTKAQKEIQRMEREASKNQRFMESKGSLHQGTQVSFDDLPRPPKAEHNPSGDDLPWDQGMEILHIDLVHFGCVADAYRR